MVRQLYPGSLVQLPNGAPAPNTAFTVWDDQAAGNNVTASLRSPDGTSAYSAVTDSYGLQQPFRGPDDSLGGPPLFIDSGIGVRFQVNSSTGWTTLYNQVQSLSAGGGGGTTAVASVAGKTGAVTLSKTDVGLANVDNTADSSKPVSDAQQAALDAKAFDSVVVKTSGNQTIDGLKSFTSSPTVPTPTAAGHAVTKSYVDQNVGGGGTAGVTTDSASTSSTLAPSAATTRKMIGQQGPVKMLSAYGAAGTSGYTSIQTPTDADSATVVANKLASNLAILNAAIADANGATIDGGPTPVALNGDLAYPTGDIKLNLLHWRGSTAQGRSIKPALRILNPFGAEMVGDILTVQVGPTNPVANIVTQYGSSGFQLPAVGGTGQDNQGGYRNVRATDVVTVYCKDAMPAAGQTGLVNTANAATWRAEQIGVHAIAVNVSSVNLTGSGTTFSGYPYASIERHTIRGALSGVTAIANSWAVDQSAGTSGKLLFASVSGDFRNGENLIDDTAGGNVIGVAGTMFIAFSGRLLWDYNIAVRMATANATTPGTWTAQQIIDARPRLRVMNKAQVKLDLTVKASHDVDTFLTTDERNVPAVELDGLYCPTIRMTTLSAYSRALLVRSCEAPDISLPSVTGIANHAIPVSAGGEEGYGYGVELRGTTRYAKVHDSHGRFLRHLFTTNPNSRTWGTTSSDGIPDYMDMGCGSMWATVRDCTATECFSAPFDTHEMAWGTRWRNLDVFSSYSGSRVVTAPAGYNTRGWADDYMDCRVNGTVGGFSNGGVALTSGVPYVSVYRNTKATEIQTQPYSFSPFNTGLNQDQSGLLASQQSAAVMHGRIAFHSIAGSLDTTITRTQGLQYGVVCDVGQFDWYGDNRFVGANDSPIRIRTGGVHVFYGGPILDFTQSAAGSMGIRLDGASNVTFLEPVKAKMKTTTFPASVVVNVSGNSVIAHKGYDGVLSTDTSTTQTRPTQPFGTTTAGTPTWTTITSTF